VEPAPADATVGHSTTPDPSRNGGQDHPWCPRARPTRPV